MISNTGTATPRSSRNDAAPLHVARCEADDPSVWQVPSITVDSTNTFLHLVSVLAKKRTVLSDDVLQNAKMRTVWPCSECGAQIRVGTLTLVDGPVHSEDAVYPVTVSEPAVEKDASVNAVTRKRT